MANRREQPRTKTRFELLCSTGRVEGHGLLGDISYSGARISETTIRPDLGTQVRLYVFVQPVSPFEIVGNVVRHTDDGFALEYKIVDPEVKRLVDDTAAIVGTSTI